MISETNCSGRCLNSCFVKRNVVFLLFELYESLSRQSINCIFSQRACNLCKIAFLERERERERLPLPDPWPKYFHTFLLFLFRAIKTKQRHNEKFKIPRVRKKKGGEKQERFFVSVFRFNCAYIILVVRCRLIYFKFVFHKWKSNRFIRDYVNYLKINSFDEDLMEVILRIF